MIFYSDQRIHCLSQKYHTDNFNSFLSYEEKIRGIFLRFYSNTSIKASLACLCAQNCSTVKVTALNVALGTLKA